MYTQSYMVGRGGFAMSISLEQSFRWQILSSTEKLLQVNTGPREGREESSVTDRGGAGISPIVFKFIKWLK